MNWHAILVDDWSGPLLNFLLQMFALLNHVYYIGDTLIQALLRVENRRLVFLDTPQRLLHLLVLTLNIVECLENFYSVSANRFAIFSEVISNRL